MSDFISSVDNELKSAGNTPTGNHLKTGDIRKLFARFFMEMKIKKIDDVFSVYNKLLEQLNWPMGVIVYDFAYRMRKQYDDKTFAVFEGWRAKEI